MAYQNVKPYDGKLLKKFEELTDQHFYKADPNYGLQVAEGVGINCPDTVGKAA